MEKLFNARAEKLLFYSPYHFIRSIKKEKITGILQQTITDHLQSVGTKKTFRFQHGEEEYIFCYQHLEWDSHYFGFTTHKLFTVLFESRDVSSLKLAVNAFITHLHVQEKSRYCFIEIPSEDILLVQALTGKGFQLTETRLTYFHPDLKRYDFDKRYAVRNATAADIPNLKQVASQMRNDYDRVHADPIFPSDISDQFLATYVEEAVKGFCDVVLVPDTEDGQPDAFLSANFLKHDWTLTGIPVSKMVLSAVAETRTGWYMKLISEMTYRLREEGAQYIFMNTQSTNRSVFKTWEKLGYALGCTTHVLSISIPS